MEIFKNPVGRPPKDLKKKRIITVIVITLVILLGGTIATINILGINMSDLMGNSTSKKSYCSDYTVEKYLNKNNNIKVCYYEAYSTKAKRSSKYNDSIIVINKDDVIIVGNDFLTKYPNFNGHVSYSKISKGKAYKFPLRQELENPIYLGGNYAHITSGAGQTLNNMRCPKWFFITNTKWTRYCVGNNKDYKKVKDWCTNQYKQEWDYAYKFKGSCSNICGN